MGVVIEFSPHLEEKRGLFRSIVCLFQVKEQLFGQLCYAHGRERQKIYKKYLMIRALLQLECSMAMSYDYRDPAMEKIRRFYATL